MHVLQWINKRSRTSATNQTLFAYKGTLSTSRRSLNDMVQ